VKSTRTIQHHLRLQRRIERELSLTNRSAVVFDEEDREYLIDLVDEALSAGRATLEAHIDTDQTMADEDELLTIVSYQQDKIRFLEELQEQLGRKGATGPKD
jgi:hypothetical protein